jgi:choline dehydrogenase-like flavoprotein
VGPEHQARLRAVPNIAMFGAMLHDDAGGRVRTGIGREPVVTYRMSPRDRARMPRLIRVLAETFLAAGAREVYLPILGHAPVTPETFARVDFEHIHGRHFDSASQHPLGSCRMGASPNTSVVDADGQVWGVRELYVADGSIVPTSLGVNPQVSIMAMATRIAWRLRERAYAA